MYSFSVSSKRVAILTSSFSALLFLISCSGKNNLQYHPQAPVRPDQTGILARGITSQDLQNLAKVAPQLQVRTLSENDGVFELFNVSEQEIRDLLGSDVELQKNFIIKRFDDKQDEAKRIEDLKKELAMFKLCLQFSPAQEKLKILAKREGLDKKPIVDLKNANVELGIDESFEKATGAAPVTYSWLFLPPTFSSQKPDLIKANTFTVKPDVLGTYQVILLAKTAQETCAKDAFTLGVTSNPAYEGPSTAPGLNEKEQTLFKQVDMTRAPGSWALAKQGGGVVVAIIDSGVNYNHPDLKGSIWVNKNEVPNNNIDDDKNGFVDDVIGWDFSDSDAQPFDDGGHGTHVAGITASGAYGIAPSAKVMPLKVFNALGSTDLGSILAAVYYASDNGAKIANMSLGGYSRNPIQVEMFKKALDYANKKGLMVIAASGNGNPQTGKGMDNDEMPIFPASLEAPNMTAVASVGFSGKLASYSNYGVKSVHLAAPGGDDEGGRIYSSFFMPEKMRLVAFQGTSMATPAVSGVAALVRSTNPLLTPAEVRDVLVQTIQLSEPLKGKVVSGGFVNAEAAVQRAFALLKAKNPELAEARLAETSNPPSVFKRIANRFSFR